MPSLPPTSRAFTAVRSERTPTPRSGSNSSMDLSKLTMANENNPQVTLTSPASSI